ncbi:hypothetical protein ACLB2K_005778 [Fragaria x ananassa]
MEIDGRTTRFADVVVEILSRLPVKSLLRFLCVSKGWHGLIKSSYFTAFHLQRSDSNLLLFKRKTPDFEDSMPLFRNESIHVSLDLPFINCPTMQFSFPLGSSNGLVCLGLCDLREEQLEYIVVWNPATKQFRFLPETDAHYLMGLEFFHDTRDYKVVNILPSGLHNTIRAKEQRSHVLSFNLRDEVFHVIIPLPEIISPRTALFSGKKSLAFLGGEHELPRELWIMTEVPSASTRQMPWVKQFIFKPSSLPKYILGSWKEDYLLGKDNCGDLQCCDPASQKSTKLAQHDQTDSYSYYKVINYVESLVSVD